MEQKKSKKNFGNRAAICPESSMDISDKASNGINRNIHKGKFLKVICGRCGNKQVIYGKSAINVKCLRCNKLIVKPGGGKTRIKTLVEEVLQCI